MRHNDLTARKPPISHEHVCPMLRQEGCKTQRSLDAAVGKSPTRASSPILIDVKRTEWMRCNA
jgi:hypothetical protein